MRRGANAAFLSGYEQASQLLGLAGASQQELEEIKEPAIEARKSGSPWEQTTP
jgi:hypothetical protein